MSGGKNRGALWVLIVAISQLTFSMAALPAQALDAPASAGTPGAPTDLAGEGWVRQVNLTWVAPADDGGSAIVEYRIYRQDGASWVQVGTSTTTSFEETGLNNGSRYRYRVTAVNSVGEGAPSDSVYATTKTFPDKPLLTRVEPQVQLRTNRLYWEAPDSTDGLPIAGYNIYRYDLLLGEDITTKGTLVAQVGDVTFWADARLPNGVYGYRISAVTLVGEGGLSNPGVAPALPFVH